MTTTRYLTLDEVIYINGRVLNNQKILRGEQQIREIELLEAAVARPAASAFGADAYPTLAEKAAALLHSVARNHPFADGNKRTATVSALMMLAVNGQRATWDMPAALDMILDVAEGRQEAAAFAVWVPTQPAPAIPAADAQRDTALIDDILAEQKWLLDELAER